MKKKICLIFSIILLIFINSCAGYEPIFGSKNLIFKIEEHSIKGNKELGNKIYSKLNNISKSNKSNQNAQTISVIINASKDKKATSKNSAGKILEYKITLTVVVAVNNFLTDNTILNQTFVSSSSYKVQTQYFDTIELENQTKENLINRIYQDLLIQLSQKIIT